jgi:hypothetical protein
MLNWLVEEKGIAPQNWCADETTVLSAACDTLQYLTAIVSD